MMLSYLKWAFIVSIFLYTIIVTLFIVPTIKTKRKVYWSDWLGWNYNWFSYWDEYKKICSERGEPLLFYWMCWGIFIFLVLSITGCFLLSFI